MLFAKQCLYQTNVVIMLAHCIKPSTQKPRSSPLLSAVHILPSLD
ncbi:hypothetical protein GPUN_0573 [Glaciecola punicea ACAM 611]|uniref:Uncharacterized protein n=1 Tax=Glaciecola punicea ACAM 611 TaxID=1121923 RepID=H5T8U0_9ALTE|nr:hypothetical protein GPUN_0573 [Glaciecola punicea ACAM 611]